MTMGSSDKTRLLQQTSTTRSKIEECARRFADRDPAVSWLLPILEARGVNPSKGILAACSEKPDAAGRLCTGTWVTAAGEFLEFRILVPTEAGAKPSVMFFDERSVSVFAHERGIARSFGRVAIEVRNEILAGKK